MGRKARPGTKPSIRYHVKVELYPCWKSIHPYECYRFALHLLYLYRNRFGLPEMNTGFLCFLHRIWKKNPTQTCRLKPASRTLLSDLKGPVQVPRYQYQATNTQTNKFLFSLYSNYLLCAIRSVFNKKAELRLHLQPAVYIWFQDPNSAQLAIWLHLLSVQVPQIFILPEINI